MESEAYEGGGDPRRVVVVARSWRMQAVVMVLEEGKSVGYVRCGRLVMVVDTAVVARCKGVEVVGHRRTAVEVTRCKTAAAEVVLVVDMRIGLLRCGGGGGCGGSGESRPLF